MLALALAYRYFNPSTKSENAAYVLALVLPCRRWSLRTARCLSIPPLGQEALPRSTARPRRHPSFHAGSPVRRNTTCRVREALRRAPVPLDLSLGSAAGEFRSSAVGPSAARRRVSHIGSDIAGSQEEFRMLRECAVHGPRFLHTRPLSRH